VDECLEWAPAIGLWHGEAAAPTKRRRVAAGHPADLILLDEPLPEALDADAPVRIRATLIGGECVFESG
jgi:predicted amidohydrolase YtcJ